MYLLCYIIQVEILVGIKFGNLAPNQAFKILGEFNLAVGPT